MSKHPTRIRAGLMLPLWMPCHGGQVVEAREANGTLSGFRLYLLPQVPPP